MATAALRAFGAFEAFAHSPFETHLDSSRALRGMSLSAQELEPIFLKYRAEVGGKSSFFF